MKNQFETIIGLEIHVQLNTLSKAFCSDHNNFGAEANQNIGPVSLALPGTLPKLNAQQVKHAVKLGIALESEINTNSRFDRKNYVYPDLPKGYQITQDASPICIGGKFTFKTRSNTKTIRIHHIHMEEDAGKSIHDMSETKSLLDYNRAGTPLLEIVTEPDFRSGQEVSDFMQALQVLLRYIEISDANMEEGSLRCDCNVSVRALNEEKLGTRAEIKNVNSKKFAKQAIEFEAKRQWNLIQNGGSVVQETRLFNAETGSTYAMRKKEDALDYRYFPDPDLLQIRLTTNDIETIKDSIEILPWIAQDELQSKYGLKEALAEYLASQKDYYTLFCNMATDYNNFERLANFLKNQIIPSKEELHAISEETKATYIKLLAMIDADKLSASSAFQRLLPFIDENPNLDLLEKAKSLNIWIENDAINLESLCKEVITKFPDKEKAYKAGKKGLIGFFMGQFMRTQKAAADPKAVQKVFENLLNS